MRSLTLMTLLALGCGTAETAGLGGGDAGRRPADASSFDAGVFCGELDETACSAAPGCTAGYCETCGGPPVFQSCLTEGETAQCPDTGKAICCRGLRTATS